MDVECNATQPKRALRWQEDAAACGQYKEGFFSLWNAERGVFISKCQMSSACVQKCMQRRMKFTTRESTECIKRIDALRVPPKLQVSRYEV